MNALRQIAIPQNGKLWIDVPKEMNNRAFEVIVMPLEQMDDSMINLLKITNNVQLSQDFWNTITELQTEASQNGLTSEILADILNDEE